MTDEDGRDVRDLLGTALRGEPPGTVDPAALMRLGKRRLRLQRAGAALGVVVVAAGIAFGASLVRQGGNSAGPDRISTAGPSGTPPDSAQVAPSRTEPPITGPASVAVTPTLPAGKNILIAQNQALAAGFSLPAGMVASTGALTFTANLPLTAGYTGGQLNATLTDHSGSGQLSVTVVVTSAGLGAVSCAGSQMTCSMQRINGISVEIETDHPTATTTRILTVAANPDGDAVVQGEVDNLTAAGKAAARPSPPLTAGQLAQLTAVIAEATH